MPDESDAAPRVAARLRPLLPLLALLALLAAGRLAGHELPDAIRWIDGLGLLGAAAFVALYALSAVVAFPASLLSLAAGATFGVARGVPLVLAGATLGAALAFLVGRHLLRPAVARRVARDARFQAIDRAVGASGFRIVFLLRLSPLVPFVLLNYAMAVTEVRFRDYLLASIGMLPAAFAYVYYGKVAGDVAAVLGGAAAPGGPGRWLLLGLGVIATVAASALVARLARRAVREATGA